MIRDLFFPDYFALPPSLPFPISSYRYRHIVIIWFTHDVNVVESREDEVLEQLTADPACPDDEDPLLGQQRFFLLAPAHCCWFTELSRYTLKIYLKIKVFRKETKKKQQEISKMYYKSLLWRERESMRDWENAGEEEMSATERMLSLVWNACRKKDLYAGKFKFSKYGVLSTKQPRYFSIWRLCQKFWHSSSTGKHFICRFHEVEFLEKENFIRNLN